jgi:hypothetical protein
VPVGAPEALRDLWVIAVVHLSCHPGGRISTNLLGGYIITVDFVDGDA